MRNIPLRFRASAPNVGGLPYVIPTSSMANPAEAIASALATKDHVMVPAGTWTLSSTISIPSGKTLIGAPGAVLVSAVALAFRMTSCFQSAVQNIRISGPHTGTSYQVILTDCTDCVVDIQIQNGNSGVHLIRSNYCWVQGYMTEMRGTGIRLSGSRCNDVKLTGGRNIGGFGVYLAVDGATGSTRNYLSAEKFCDPATLTPFQLGASFYDAVTGRIGLEALGITIGNDSNILRDIAAFDTGDNGISVTSDGNTGGNFVIGNCDHDGLHIYGSYNSFAGVTARGNRFSGVGISQSSTAGLASFNSVTGIVSDGNLEYGVEIKDIANGNFVAGALGTSVLGGYSDTSGGLNRYELMGQDLRKAIAAQVSFVGVSDLAPGYGVRTAYFEHDGRTCSFWLALRFTPTYTVPGAPGEFRISVPGLPAALSTAALAVTDVAGLTWPTNATQLSARFEGGSVIRVRAQGPSLAAQSLNTSNFPVGQQVSLTISGVYFTV